MSYLDKITSPTLLLDEKICRANLKNMADKAKRHGKKLVPHFKTAQSHQIGEWAKEYGITEVTASSIKMAEYLSDQGWENIHIAFPFNPLEIPRLNKLAATQSISVQLINPVTTQMLVDKLEHPVGFFIEIDAGYGRTGVEVSDFGLIEEILRTAKKSDKLRFKGFYIHAGHSYYIKDIPGYVWKRVLESGAASDTVLQFEATLTKSMPGDKKYAFEERSGKVIKQYSAEFTIAYNNMMNGMVERRMRLSIASVASFWYTAWINAGQPDLKNITMTAFSEEDMSEFESLNSAWKSNSIKGRQHE